MAAKLTNPDQIRQALLLSGGKPVEIEDDQTSAIYVIVARDEFRQRYQTLYDDSELDLSEVYPLADEVFGGPEGWDAPGMEQYDQYDEHRKPE
jgi:hypothetical protein